MWLSSWTDEASRDPTLGPHYDLVEEVRRTGAPVSAVDLLSLGRKVKEAETLFRELGDGDAEVLR